MKRNEAFVVCSCLFIVVEHVYKFPIYIFDHWPQGWAGGQMADQKVFSFCQSENLFFWLSVRLAGKCLFFGYDGSAGGRT